MQALRMAGIGLLAAVSACGPRTEADDLRPARGEVVSDVDDRLLEERAEFLAAWASDDVDATAEFFTNSVTVSQNGETVVRGKAELRPWLTEQLAAITNLRIDRHQFVRSDEEEIIERGRYTVTVQPPGESVRNESGDYTTQWQFEGAAGNYRIEEMTIDADM